MVKFTFKIAKWHFDISIIGIIATIMGLVFLISLGFWQLERAAQKRVIDRQINQKKSQIIHLNQKQPIDDWSAFLYSKVKVTGRFKTNTPIIYDNNTMHGAPGVFVLYPFEFDNQAVLVNLGFVPIRNRANLSKIRPPVPKQILSIRGRLIQPVKRFMLGNNKLKTKQPILLVSQIVPLEISQALDMPLVPLVLELDNEHSFGLKRDWQAYVGSVDKHIGYALQWFGFAGIFLIVMLALHRIKH